jgi:trehalose 6-phosphate synthase
MSGLGQDTDFFWYGWPGVTVSPAETRLMEKRLRKEHKEVPVFMDEELACKHYNGFSGMYHAIFREQL